MLAVEKELRGRRIGSKLVKLCLDRMQCADGTLDIQIPEDCAGHMLDSVEACNEAVSCKDAIVAHAGSWAQTSAFWRQCRGFVMWR